MSLGHVDSFAVVLRVINGVVENSALVFRIGDSAKKVQLNPEIEFVLSHLIQSTEEIPDNVNTVWPQEVNFLFDQVTAARTLPTHLQNKLRHHINRLKIDGLPIEAIIQTATTLTAAMGATA